MKSLRDDVRFVGLLIGFIVIWIPFSDMQVWGCEQDVMCTGVGPPTWTYVLQSTGGYPRPEYLCFTIVTRCATSATPGPGFNVWWFHSDEVRFESMVWEDCWGDAYGFEITATGTGVRNGWVDWWSGCSGANGRVYGPVDCIADTPTPSPTPTPIPAINNNLKWFCLILPVLVLSMITRINILKRM